MPASIWKETRTWQWMMQMLRASTLRLSCIDPIDASMSSKELIGNYKFRGKRGKKEPTKLASSTSLTTAIRCGHQDLNQLTASKSTSQTSPFSSRTILTSIFISSTSRTRHYPSTTSSSTICFKRCMHSILQLKAAWTFWLAFFSRGRKITRFFRAYLRRRWTFFRIRSKQYPRTSSRHASSKAKTNT